MSTYRRRLFMANQGYEINDGILKYIIKNSTATVSGVYSTDVIQMLTIPAEVQGYKVTTIGSHAFEYNESVRAITLPDSINRILPYAFFECGPWGLTSINLPPSLQVIGKYAFARSHISSISIPGSVQTIEESAFDTCSDLEQLTLNEGIITIGNTAFYKCDSLTNIVIPDSVRQILYAAFKRDASFTTINVGSKVQFMAKEAFASGASQSFTITAVTPPTQNGIFNTSVTPNIFVPSQSVEAYKTAWPEYAERIQAIA